MRFFRLSKLNLFLVGLGVVFLTTVAFKFFNREINILPAVQNSGSNENSKIANSSPFWGKPDFPVKAIYISFYTASERDRFQKLVKLVEETELNGVVIDLKDFSGQVGFLTRNVLAQEIGAVRPYIPDLKKLIDDLHQRGIYVIGRIVVFQDPILAKARPSWAVKTKNGDLWKDRKGLAWLDPAVKEVWDYNLALAKEVARLGIDEINFDYIRFPSDGDIAAMKFPVWSEDIPKIEIIRSFADYLNNELAFFPGKISIDIFGLVFYADNDLNIGQHLETLASYFDVLSPMVYPSHYPPGFLNFKNPAAHPYEIIKTTLKIGNQRLKSLQEKILAVNATNTPEIILKIRQFNPEGRMPKIRPWLQDFDLGAQYSASLIRQEISAVEATNGFGWMLWSPANIYTQKVLIPTNED